MNKPLPEIICKDCGMIQVYTYQQQHCKSCGKRLSDWSVVSQLRAWAEKQVIEGK